MRRRPPARLVIVLLALVACGAGAAAYVLLRDEGPARPSVLDGGSSFGRDRARTNRGRRPLGRGEAAAAARPTEGLPLPPARAAARLMLVGFVGTEPRAAFFGRLRRLGWGGVVLERGNYVDPAQLAALTGEISLVVRESGAGAPIIAARHDGGADTAFPGLPPAEASATPEPAAARREAVRAGRQLRELGVSMVLAPPASVGTAGGPWEGLAFGDRPAGVAAAVTAAVDGWREGGVAPVPGRFPGEGGATQDPGDGVSSVGLGLSELEAADLVPFARAARRAPAIQMSPALYAAFDGVTPATLLPEAVGRLRALGFRGVVVSADLAVTTLATGGSVAEAAVDALRAGCDLLWVPGDVDAQEEAYRAVVRAIRSGDVPAARVRDALNRVSALKRAFRIR